MPRYVLDTSWISNPVLDMPQDVHVTLWAKIAEMIEAGVFCWNTEIWDEMDGSIPGDIGVCLTDCKDNAVYEVGADHWDWEQYLHHVERIRTDYRHFISEYNGNRKNTVGLNDCSIVCLGKTLGLPVASMEKKPMHRSDRRMRIPELCIQENVDHFDLTELLRQEGITA